MVPKPNIKSDFITEIGEPLTTQTNKFTTKNFLTYHQKIKIISAIERVI
jgi:hypothetical protein